jgi:hypothetical protein
MEPPWFGIGKSDAGYGTNLPGRSEGEVADA